VRKLMVFSGPPFWPGALAGGVQAIADQVMPDQGLIKARWHQLHYGWRHHYSRRYANYTGSRNSSEIRRGGDVLSRAPDRHGKSPGAGWAIPDGDQYGVHNATRQTR
jgi:hypothetical protein